MGEEDFKKIITTHINQQKVEADLVDWSKLITTLKGDLAFVSDLEENSNANMFTRAWCRRIKEVAATMGVVLPPKTDLSCLIRRVIGEPGGSNCEETSPTSGDTSSTTSSASKLGYKLSDSEKKSIEEIYNQVDPKWELSSKRYVEDAMKEFTTQLEYEHPACSLILDLDDEHWKDVFSAEELQQIEDVTRTTRSVEFPASMRNFLNNIPDTDDLKQIFLHINKQIVNPFENRDVYWLKMTLQQAADMYLTKYLPVTDQNERDIMRRAWGFIDTAYDASELTFRSEKTSYTSQLSNNKKRKLAAVKMMSRQAAGEVPDMLIFYNRYEFGAAEVSKSETNNTKEKNDASLKLVKLMKSMLINLVQSAPQERRNLKIVGMFFSGMKATFYELSNPFGQVCVVKKTNEIYLPVHPLEFINRMTPFVEQVWINKLEMEARLKSVLTSKLKASSDDESLIPCFIRTK